MTAYLLAVDGGSQSTKVSVIDQTGTVHATGRAALRPYELGPDGYAVHPGDDLWESLVVAIREALDAFAGTPADITAVGLCSIRYCRCRRVAYDHAARRGLSVGGPRVKFMATSAQIQQKLAALHTKRADIEKKIGVAQGKKAKKDSEADARTASAVKASSDSMRRMYERQAQSARKEALRESDKVASLTKDVAKVAGDIGTQQKALTAAQKSEAATAKRESDKVRQTREAQQRKEAQERKAEERRRQRDRLEDERRRESDRASTTVQIADTERRLAAEIATLREPKAEELRILYATSTADKKRPLRVDQEMRRVKAAVKASTHRELVAIEYLPAATPNDVLDTLVAFRPHVVHFSGHANESLLAFDEGTDGYGPNEGNRIGPDLFRELLESTDEAPVLVVLNACRSAAQLDLLLGKVAMAVGMEDTIGDIDAIVFATRFYSTLAEGQSVEAALTTARVEMKLNGLPDHELPTLRTVDGVVPAEIRLITGE